MQENRNHQRGRRPTPLSDLDPALTEISRRVIGCAIETHKELGPGYPIEIYRKALAHELKHEEIAFEFEKSFHVEFDGENIGTVTADMYVGDRFLLKILADSDEVFQRELSGKFCPHRRGRRYPQAGQGMDAHLSQMRRDRPAPDAASSSRPRREPDRNIQGARHRSITATSREQALRRQRQPPQDGGGDVTEELLLPHPPGVLDGPPHDRLLAVIRFDVVDRTHTVERTGEVLPSQAGI